MFAWVSLLRPGIMELKGVQLALNGYLTEATRVLAQTMERDSELGDVKLRSGAALLRLLLISNREHDLDELLSQLSLLYAKHRRSQARWLLALDTAAVQLHRRRSGRVAELLVPFLSGDCPIEHRREAMILLAYAMAGLGDVDCGEALLEGADSWNEHPTWTHDIRAFLVQSIRSVGIDSAEISEECASYNIEALPNLVQPLARWQCALERPACTALDLHGHLQEFLPWCAVRKADAWSEEARVRASLTLLNKNASTLAHEVLGGLAAKWQTDPGYRLALPLRLCSAKLLSETGRHAEASLAFLEYSRQSEWRLRREYKCMPRLPLRFTQTPGADSAVSARLPARYRRVFSFVLSKVSDPHLSVSQMAAHINVTERALQQTFRRYLGMTPSEFVRNIRVSRLSEDLLGAMPGESSEAVATQWGLGKRARLRSSAMLELGHNLPSKVG
jgi:AraC-like DNA-binding protein